MNHENKEQTDNPLLVETGFPLFDRVRPEHAIPAIRDVLKRANEQFDNAISDIANDGVNSGDDNRCSDVSDWNDDGTTGCTAPCSVCGCVGRLQTFACGDVVTENCTLNCDLESSGTCFTVGLDGVKIEGDGHSISGNGRGNGVESIDKTTVRIQNIAISGFSRGILLEEGSHATLTNATLTGNIYGIEMKNTMNNTVCGNTITGNSQAGIYMDSRCAMNSLNNNVVCPNGVYDISDHGINSGGDDTCDDPDNWNDDGETGCTHTCFACSCHGASADFVCGDTITESCTLDCNLNAAGDCFSVAQDGITIDGDGYRITGNGSGVAFHLTGRTGVTIKNASVGEFSTGILMDGLSHGNTIMENEICGNVHGVRLENSSQNTISENEIAFNQQAGIYTDADSEDNMFLSNDVCSPLGTDIYDAEESEGDDNACSTYYDYNDDGAAGCTRACFRWQSDGDGDGASDTDEMGPDSDDSEYDGDQDGNADLIDQGTASFHTYGGQGYATLEAPEGVQSLHQEKKGRPNFPQAAEEHFSTTGH